MGIQIQYERGVDSVQFEKQQSSALEKTLVKIGAAFFIVGFIGLILSYSGVLTVNTAITTLRSASIAAMGVSAMPFMLAAINHSVDRYRENKSEEALIKEYGVIFEISESEPKKSLIARISSITQLFKKDRAEVVESKEEEKPLINKSIERKNKKANSNGNQSAPTQQITQISGEGTEKIKKTQLDKVKRCASVAAFCLVISFAIYLISLGVQADPASEAAAIIKDLQVISIGVLAFSAIPGFMSLYHLALHFNKKKREEEAK